MILRVKHNDVDLQRKGRVLAVILLVMALGVVVLAAFNLAHGDEYTLSNVSFFLVLAALFALNRAGHVTGAGLLTVALLTAGSLYLLSTDDTLKTTFIAMCIPVLLASFLIVPWSGFLITTMLIVGYMTIDITTPDNIGIVDSGDYPALLALVVVSSIAYMLSSSLNRAYEETRRQALHDSLTGLPNRALFTNRLQQSIDRKSRESDTSAVLYMDLDQFKIINDSLGHETGDRLLIEVSRRLRSCLRPGDTAARLGGDEFTILLDDISGPADAVRVAERVAEELREPFRLGEHQVFVTTSVGIALNDSAGVSPNSLLRNADVAMYDAKKEGKARYKIFDPGMHAKAIRRLEMENELRRAITQEELRIHYQPKVSLDTGEIVGMEALVRWDHPEQGLINPNEFIPLAEETLLINPLGRWVLQEACRQAREWRRRYPDFSDLVMSVNLSVRQFQQPNLISELSEVLEETGLDPCGLQLEITESVMTDDAEYAVDLLQKLRILNVQLGLDDFGKGYSSLTSLRQFPLDDLKIDKSFVEGIGQNVQDTAIVQLMVDLAHTVGMQVVGEGVERAEQLTRLREMGCDLAQGFYLSRPLTSEEAEALLADSPRSPSGSSDSPVQLATLQTLTSTERKMGSEQASKPA
jgi:diguanylate cyclase (GGDEF)-like protein